MFNSKRKRKAGVLTEVYFAILMISAALMLINVLFGKNIAEMINNNSFKQAIEKGNERKTTFKMTNKGSVRYNISAPEAQMAGWEAVLGRYNTNAKESIEDYYKKAQTTPLTDAEVKDLAKWLAIFANSSTDFAGSTLLNRTYFETNPSLSYYSFGTSQGLSLNYIDDSKIIKTNSITMYDWGSNNPLAIRGNNSNAEPRDRVENIRGNNGIIYTFENSP